MGKDLPKSVSALSAVLPFNNRSVTTCVLELSIQKVCVFTNQSHSMSCA